MTAPHTGHWTDEPCIDWPHSTNKQGYGQQVRNGKLHRAHRLAYVDSGKTIPPGLEIDHLCRNRRCINPLHMEPVTHAENCRRARKTHCKHGHPLSGDNARIDKRGYPHCRTCTRERGRKPAAALDKIHSWV